MRNIFRTFIFLSLAVAAHSAQAQVEIYVPVSTKPVTIDLNGLNNDCEVEVVELSSSGKGSRIVVPKINEEFYLTDMVLGSGWYTTDELVNVPSKDVNAVIKRTKNSKKETLEESKQKTWNVVFDNAEDPTSYSLDVTDEGKTKNLVTKTPTAPQNCKVELVEILSEMGGSSIIVPKINSKLDLSKMVLGRGWYTTDEFNSSDETYTVVRKKNSKGDELSPENQKMWNIVLDSNNSSYSVEQQTKTK